MKYQRLLDNPDFKEFLSDFLSGLEELTNVNNLTEIKRLSDKRAGEEIKSTVKAYEIVMELLSPVLDNRERKKVSQEEINKAKRRYAL